MPVDDLENGEKLILSNSSRCRLEAGFNSHFSCFKKENNASEIKKQHELIKNTRV